MRKLVPAVLLIGVVLLFGYMPRSTELSLPTLSWLVASQSVYFPKTQAERVALQPSQSQPPFRALLAIDDETDPATTPPPDIEWSEVDDDPGVMTVTVAPQSPDGYDEYGGVFIKNGTDQRIDVRSYLESDLDYSRVESGAEIIIVHTHASEAFYPEGDDAYIPTDVSRTEDLRFNVVRLGDALAEVLEARGINVLHIRDIFDYPSYNGSYTRALAAVENALQDNPNARMVLDIHRDGMVAQDGTVYRTVTTIDGRRAAQIMIVAGTDEGGLAHPSWKQNLAFATHLQCYINERFENLMRPILLSKSRYNQHTTPMSLIIEIGTSGNTLKEALYSTTLLGEALCDMLEPFR